MNTEMNKKKEMKHEHRELLYEDVILGSTDTKNKYAYAHKIICQAFENPCGEINPVLLVAAPGNGKTFFMDHGAAYAKANGDSVKIITATQFQELFCQKLWECKEQKDSLFLAVISMFHLFAQYNIVIIENLESLQGMEETLDWVFYFVDYFVRAEKQVFVTSEIPMCELLDIKKKLVLWENGLEIEIPELSHQFKLYVVKELAKKYELELDIIDVAAIASSITSMRLLVSRMKQIRAMCDLLKCSAKEAVRETIDKYL